MSWSSVEKQREWRAANKDRLNTKRRQKYLECEEYRGRKIAQASLYRQRNQNIVREHKMKVGCRSCGYKGHHVALDLHHKDKSLKEFKIASTTVSVDRLMSELAKCEVLCANCHKIHHFQEGWLK